MHTTLTGAPLRRSALFIALGCAVSAGAFAAAPGNAPQALAQVRDTALQSDWAYARLADMTDLIGPRLSGSAGAAAAVRQVAETMRQLGATVTLQPVKVPHWVRGVETAEIVDYAGRPQGVSQRVVLTALGGSGATPATGLTAPVIIVKSLEELKARASEVKDAIVLIDTPFDQEMAERGLAGVTYGQGSRFRFNGPKAAADLGAAAALVRSVGGANFRIPHAGATGLDENKRIPAAAVTVEDALLIGRLAARGPLKMHLTLTPQNLPEADSYNVIADWPGTDKADEVVVVSGHLDSWDLATGAHDDGAGVVAAMGVLETLKKLDYRPRRTIRVIAWMNEENGGRGGQAYFEAHKQALGKQYAAIEMDSGAGRPFGILASVAPKSEKLFAPLRAALQPMGAHAFTRRDALGTGDLHRLETGGVPSFEPLVDSHNYFHYHHTAADTLDKVDPENLKRNVALMSSLAWFLANIDGEIGRAPEQGE
ncbi:M20/M25/M40 family metallo-hydrolase [Janthinobacterium sp. PAMC25594]|uniref:M20/M25/M40 family metallo-hydrolase n=1 Tax=Janthinobacterium sp. PAMC25594 TaxID=2861284 RepID=UPI001C62C1AB|nr:M20/M25/M40 family metallo-hydrolase [Janthinobacterium sp. PAMC25594]QYG07085.1 M20/M25/M40 family metallo-hydrolase [Janthinobacterium sp. PAMC25594]